MRTLSAFGNSIEPTRAIGWINLVIAGLGLLQLAMNVIGYSALGHEFVEKYGPFMVENHRFARMSFTAIILLLPLGVAGCLLLLKIRHATTFTIVFFVLDIAVLAWTLSTWSMPFLFIDPTMIAIGLMNGGLALQIVTGYPLIALILLVKNVRETRAGGTG